MPIWGNYLRFSSETSTSNLLLTDGSLMMLHEILVDGLELKRQDHGIPTQQIFCVGNIDSIVVPCHAYIRRNLCITFSVSGWSTGGVYFRITLSLSCLYVCWSDVPGRGRKRVLWATWLSVQVAV